MPDFHSETSTVPLDAARPLLIVDADEVLLKFVDGFDRFLAGRNHYFDFASYALHGNVRRRADSVAVSEAETNALLEEFRSQFDSLEAVEGAREALAALAPLLDIVVLSNMTPGQAPPRLRNFDALGIVLPLVINSGLKGPAVKAFAARAGRPVFFIDDIPRHHASVSTDAPEVFRIHLIGDERLRRLAPPAPHAHLQAENWNDAVAFIRARLKAR